MQSLLASIAAAAPGPDARRVFHGRGGLFPGEEAWTLDLFPPVALLTSFRPATEDELAAVGAALAARWPALMPDSPLCWVHQCRQEGRTETRTMAGAVPEPHLVTEDGLRFELRLLHRGQGRNHGFFLDMAEGRRWLRDQLSTGPRARVLNLFAYTCAFSVVALAAGAESVVNLDMSAGALAAGRQNHRLNGLEAGARFLAHDLFNSWGKLRRGGPYDVVIVDPPSYQKGSFVATKDYARVLRRLPELLAPGGHALLCLNAPELPEAFLRDALAAEAPALRILQRLPNPPAFDDVSSDRALKVLVARAPD
jgi:23S rRNA (cytosine1962-C5)-methyltransferase